jgi:hypothetical protein
LPKLDDDDCDIALFMAIEEFLSLVHGEKTNCGLKGLCNVDPEKSLVNEACDSNPWLQREREPRCYFSMLCWLWGLDKFELSHDSQQG